MQLIANWHMIRVVHRNFHFQQGHFYSLKLHQDDLRRILKLLKEKKIKKIKNQKNYGHFFFWPFWAIFANFAFSKPSFGSLAPPTRRFCMSIIQNTHNLLLLTFLKKNLKNIEITWLQGSKTIFYVPVITGHWDTFR